jgi:lysophospholipase
MRVGADGAAPAPVAGHAPVVGLPGAARAWEAGLALRAADGVALRAALWNPDGDRGLALYLPGRTEFLEKSAVAATALAARGFAVATLDWRGQGLSERPLAEPMKGHVERFGDFERDLAALLAAPEIAALGPPRLALAHSMGGAIALGAAARGLLAPRALVLSAPLAGIAYAGAGRGIFRVMAKGARRLGLGHRWPPVMGAKVPYVFRAFEGNCLTCDPALYAWHGVAFREAPALALGLPTLGWMAAAEAAMARIAAMAPPQGPGLVLLGTEERVVDPAAAALGAERLRYRLARIEGARHEPLIEAPGPRAAAWAALDAFLDGAG